LDGTVENKAKSIFLKFIAVMEYLAQRPFCWLIENWQVECTARTVPCTSRAVPCTARTMPCTSRTVPCTARNVLIPTGMTVAVAG